MASAPDTENTNPTSPAEPLNGDAPHDAPHDPTRPHPSTGSTGSAGAHAEAGVIELAPPRESREPRDPVARTAADPLVVPRRVEYVAPPAATPSGGEDPLRIHPRVSWWTEILGAVLAVAVAAGFLLFVSDFLYAGHPGNNQNGYLVSGKLLATTGNPGFEPKNAMQFVGWMWNMADADSKAEGGGMMFSKYPLGYPALVAAVWKLAPAGQQVLWCYWINPVAMALALLGTYVLSRQIMHPLAAVLASLLVGSNPVLLILTNQPYSHATAVCFAVWGAAATLAFARNGNLLWGVLGGLLLGYAATIRYTEGLLGLCIGVAALFWVTYRPRREVRWASIAVWVVAITAVMLLATPWKGKLLSEHIATWLVTAPPTPPAPAVAPGAAAPAVAAPAEPWKPGALSAWLSGTIEYGVLWWQAMLAAAVLLLLTVRWSTWRAAANDARVGRYWIAVPVGLGVGAVAWAVERYAFGVHWPDRPWQIDQPKALALFLLPAAAAVVGAVVWHALRNPFFRAPLLRGGWLPGVVAAAVFFFVAWKLRLEEMKAAPVDGIVDWFEPWSAYLVAIGAVVAGALLVLIPAIWLLYTVQWRRVGTWIRPTIAVAAWCVPVVALLVVNKSLMGTWTGYDTTNESDGFTYAKFLEKWRFAISELYNTGAYFTLPLGLFGLLALLQWRFRQGLVLVCWLLPLALIYMAYYWGMQGGVGFGVWGFLRFYATILPAIAIGAVWVTWRVIGSAPKHRWLGFAAAFVVIGYAAYVNVNSTLWPLRRDGQITANIAYTTQRIQAKVPAGSVFMAESQRLLNHIQFACDYELYGTDHLAGSPPLPRIPVGRQARPAPAPTQPNVGDRRRTPSQTPEDPDANPIQQARIDFYQRTVQQMGDQERRAFVTRLVAEAAKQGRGVYAATGSEGSERFRASVLRDVSVEEIDRWTEPTDGLYLGRINNYAPGRSATGTDPGGRSYVLLKITPKAPASEPSVAAVPPASPPAATVAAPPAAQANDQPAVTPARPPAATPKPPAATPAAAKPTTAPSKTAEAATPPADASGPTPAASDEPRPKPTTAAAKPTETRSPTPVTPNPNPPATPPADRPASKPSAEPAPTVETPRAPTIAPPTTAPAAAPPVPPAPVAVPVPAPDPTPPTTAASNPSTPSTPAAPAVPATRPAAQGPTTQDSPGGR
jgi:hypothetical protein